MSVEWIIAGLLGWSVFRELHFHYQAHKLIDKLMCRSLHEYKLAQTAGRHEPVSQIRDEGIPEDMGVLAGLL